MKLSRRKLAQYVASELMAGVDQSQLMRELAAYIVQSGTKNQLDMILSDVSRELALLGVMQVDVTTATKLTDELRNKITTYVQQSVDGGTDLQVSIAEHIDADILGGVIIETPNKRLDASTKNQLTKLRNS